MSRLYERGRPARRGFAANVGAAVCAVLIFHAVSVASGKLDVNRGRGWDGAVYSEMAAGALSEGGPNARTRPLIVLVARIPYALGVGIVDSFHLLNYLYAFGLYLITCLLLERYGAPLPVRAVVVANLALTIATSKMFAFYPTQIDLGALAITTLAFYFAATDRRWLAGAACVLAAASREFGVAASLFGAHRALRLRRRWMEALVYVPGIATTLLLRWWSATQAGGGDPFAASDAVQNLGLWNSPAFAAAFAFFAVTIFGGVSALLIMRARWCLGRLREQPELATFLIVVVGASVVGNLDIWRYLAFALPVAVVLFGQYCRALDRDDTRRILIATTLVTVFTQRPFEQMDTTLYFRDWFPLYYYFGVHPPVDDLAAVWSIRAVALLLMMIALHVITRPAPAHEPQADIAGAAPS